MSKQIDNFKNKLDIYIRWLETRSFYGQAPQVNILERLKEQNSRVGGEPPSAPNSSYCNALNHVLANAEENDRDYFLCFVWIYFRELRQGVKTFAFAAELGIDRDTVYQRAHKAAVKYDNEALKLEEYHLSELTRLSEAMRREIKEEYERGYSYE